MTPCGMPFETNVAVKNSYAVSCQSSEALINPAGMATGLRCRGSIVLGKWSGQQAWEFFCLSRQTSDLSVSREEPEMNE